jgi:xanthine/uracil permease
MTAAPTAPPAPTAKRVHPVDEVLPPGKLAIYGIQHVLAFYAGAVIVPILLVRSQGALVLEDEE